MNRRCSMVALLAAVFGSQLAFAGDTEFRVATFRVDITIPLGHRCMGVLPTKSSKIVDPLEARGFVLLGLKHPVVIVALDWCEVRNDSYDQWRRALAVAAGTSSNHVLLSSNHQHDAPVVDAGAARLLAGVGLADELFDDAFHGRTLLRVTQGVKAAIQRAQPVTHIGLGQAKVERVASSRRVVDSDGKVRYHRGSRSGITEFFRNAPEGVIDPFLKTISFWNGDTPILAIHSYATHPMSHYGQGGVSWDFVGIARDRRQKDDPKVFQIYASGCSGDVTAGKYNNGSAAHRTALADRLYQAMLQSWQSTKKHPLKNSSLRISKVDFEFHGSPELGAGALTKQLHDKKQTVESRIHAAMSLASRERVAAGRGIEVPCLDLGQAQILLLPGESFVAYQLRAQKLRPDSFVMAIGYGECWPGYIPTDADFRAGFSDKWLWVAPGSEAKLLQAMSEALGNR